MQPHIAALGWLRTPGQDAQADHLALPTDLFMVTVHHTAEQSPGQSGSILEMAVTLLRTRPERFRSRVAGELAFALLTPAGLLALLRAPLEGLTDRRMPLAQFCTSAELSALRDALLTEPDARLRLAIFGAWIESRVHERHGFGTPQQRVAQAAMAIQCSAGSIELASVRRALRISRRQLERDFRLWLGVSPAGYARLVRFQRAASALADGDAPSHAAADHGFNDQSHMHRAFKQFSALTPRVFTHLAARPHRQIERRALAGRIVVLDAPAESAAQN
ncbi:MAG: helix-turn-helix transcriptional regulator [Burkholderiaceae bacterium]